jgi:putative transposase
VRAAGQLDAERTAVRHGSERGSVTLGGRLVGVQRPRMRGTDGEVPVPSYELFNGNEILGRMAMTKLLGGLSSRCYRVRLEPVGETVEPAASVTIRDCCTSRPSLTRRHPCERRPRVDIR